MEVPTHIDMAAPTLKALERLGGSATNHELVDEVANIMGLPDDVREEPHGDGRVSEVEYRSGWTRSYLKKLGAIENSSRGVWSLTEYGRGLDSQADFRQEFLAIAREYGQSSRRTGSTSSDERSQPGETSDSGSDPFDESRQSKWQDDLLAILREMEPSAFERLCQRILREKGLTNVKVTGGAGDGGIDGTGILRLNLISFRVVFQCKRYAGSVGDPEIRNLRGAMVGRGADKGLFLTTGRFSRPAEEEATRVVPTIELIDGTELCQLLKELQLGVQMVESVDPAFFASFASN